ncbi:5'-nucleotidase C-terminal domain-containing protein [Bacillus sp. X1(2014)]|uniref:5'-nucleotidase C-terminal domain-containing protein n=1 Tax=Bacillus sp. X1(2014) TaxID=1565991 RepID=UPI0021B294AF|nr:5'-nucleotidase C-terminal domain-containing protein [Bacillus sp. X1(2014)]
MTNLVNRSKKWISLALTAILLLAMVLPTSVSAAAETVSLAKWDFSSATNKLVATSGTAANLDKTLSVTGPTISATYVGGPSTGIQVPNASPWTANPSFWKVAVSTKGYQNITLSSKQYGSSTGPRDFKIQYSLDNSTWTDVPGATVTVATNWTSGVLTNIALPSETNNQDVVYVRWLKNSDTAINGSPIASGGTSRMGLIEFNGEAQASTPQPDPGAVPGQGKIVLGDEPLANITFSLRETATGVWHDFTSDENGVFTHNLADGTYKIEGLWVAPTWYPLGQTVTIKDGLVDGLHELAFDALNPVEGTWNVSGTVKNGSQALAQLPFSVHSTDGKWYDAKTDKNGKFNFKLPDGSYQVDGIWDAAAGKWYELNQLFTVKDGKLEGSTELLLDISGVFNVTGTITKGTTALSETVFSIHTASGEEKWFDGQTDKDGKFALKLPNGDYTIDGIWDSVAGKWYELKKNFTVAGTLQLNIDVLKDGTGVITPNVTGVLTKGTETLPNVVFSVHTTTGNVTWYDITTDANGKYSTILPNGSYMLEGIWLGTENHWYDLQKEFTVDGTKEFNIDVLAGQADKKFTLNLMHTNDTHANIDNVAKKMTAIKSVRATKPDALLLDAGDVFSGTLYFNEYKGLADLEFMELAGYDAMTFGNHEFDLGTETLANFVKEADFPFVSANVNFVNDTNLQSRFHNDVTTANPLGGEIYNGIIKVVNGEKIGIFGLTTAETATISSPGAGVAFENYIDEAQKSVDALKAQGVNKIIALTHIGFDDSLVWDNDQQLAASVEGIDVIVGGHSHTKLDAPFFDTTGDEPTAIVSANEYNKYLGTVDVTFDASGKVIVPETTGKLLDITTFADDAAVANILNTKYKPAIDAMKATVVGTAVAPLVGGNPPARVGETNLGNFVADGMLAKAKTINPNTVIALQNGGGVRVTLPAGNITLADVFKVLPFGNALGIMELKGAEIKEALEYSVKDAPAAFGGFLQVSGLKFTYDSTKPAGSKVQSIEVKGQDGSYTALDLTKNYFVATNIFTAKGGDGYTVFAKAYAEGRVSEPGFVDWEMFREYIEAQPNKTVNPQVEGRIINVAPQVIPAASFSGTADAPKVYFGNVVVDVTGVAKLENATVKGNLTLKGNNGVELSNVTVEGDTIFED